MNTENNLNAEMILYEGTPITDNHERRIHDPSIYKLRGKVLNVFFDEPYPVMTPKDEKMMREMSDEIREKFQDYVESETGIPRETLVIDSLTDTVKEKAANDAILYGDSFVQVYRVPRWVERYLETQRWIEGIRDPKIDILTGCTQNFKVQQKIDKLEALYDILDTEAPDRNGRIWTRKVIEDVLNNRIYLIPPRGRKTWLWLKLLELQKSYEIKLQKTLGTPPSTKFELKSVIYMSWPKPDLSNLKARDFRYGKMWQDQELINYATGDTEHIDRLMLDTLRAFGPGIDSTYELTTPNLNDKKKLERVIDKRRKKK